MVLQNKFQSCVRLVNLKVFQHHLDITHQVDEHTFQTKVYYYDVDLPQLSTRYGERLINKILAYIALAETFKYCSLFPRTIDLSLIGKYLDEKAIHFFLHTFKHAYAQCSYENDIGMEYEPILIMGASLQTGQTIPSFQELGIDTETILVGNGGGKDSFLAMKLLEQSQLHYSTYQWTRPEYGRSQYQHALCAKLLDHTSAQQSHKVSVYDDFTESPFMQFYYPHLKGAFTLGIPECIFEALPLMLSHQYPALCFANERSADTGNLYWEKIQTEVNHQWVKSIDAERFFQDFINQTLLRDFKFFSILKPIFDYRIFNHLAHYPAFMKQAHSCNIDKPWCKKCPKCAYVWLAYLAYFDKPMVDAIFGTNPFNDEDLFVHYKNMTGIEGHRSFECIGNIEECQLFMKKCIDKGLEGKMLEHFKETILRSDKNWELVEQKFNQIHFMHNIPDVFFQKIKDNL